MNWKVEALSVLTFEHLQLYQFMGSSSLKSMDLEKPVIFLNSQVFSVTPKKNKVSEAVGIYDIYIYVCVFPAAK